MSKPISIQTEPFTSFGSAAPTVFTDDFVQKDQLTIKTKSVSNNGATFNAKQTVNSLKFKDQLKFWFPLQGQRFIYTKITNKNAKIQYDHGITVIRDSKFNFYGSIGFQKDLTNIEIKAGVSSLSEKCNSNNRLKLTQDGTLTWYHKTLLKHQQFRFGILGVYNISASILAKKEFLFGYLKNQYNVFIKAEQDWDKNTKGFANAKTFNKVSLTALWQRTSENRIGIEVTADPSKTKLSDISLLGEQQLSNGIFAKGKLNYGGGVSCLLRKKWNSSLTTSVGADLILTGKAKGIEKAGFQFELTI